MGYFTPSGTDDKLAAGGRETNYTRRRSHRDQPKRRSRSWVRLLYFGLASLWGYVIGAAVLVAALSFSGHSVTLNPVIVGLIVPGAVVAFIGGVLSAAAYRQATRRTSS